MQSKIIWQAQALNGETPRDAAARFVAETFGVERRIVWGAEPGEFRFADGAWHYAIAFNGGHWQVRRLSKPTPQAKAVAKARRATRGAR